MIVRTPSSEERAEWLERLDRQNREDRLERRPDRERPERERPRTREAPAETVRRQPPLPRPESTMDPVESFYKGLGVPCPMGCPGAMERVAVNTLPDGRGELWFECSSCAQRVSYETPAVTKAERKQVTEMVDSGQEIVCPRHFVRPVLRRRGRQLACPECGVVYRET